MSHKCGSNCRKRQSPSTQKDCPCCGSASRKRQRWARKVMANPIKEKPIHDNVEEEWVYRTLVRPYRSETDADGRDMYYGPLPEVNNWVKVVVENDRLLTAYRDRRLLRRFGRPWRKSWK